MTIDEKLRNFLEDVMNDLGNSPSDAYYDQYIKEIKALFPIHGFCQDCDYLDTFNDDYDGKFFCRLESCPVDQIYDDQIYVFGCNDFQPKESE